MIYSYACKCGRKKNVEFPMGKPKVVKCTCRKHMKRLIAKPKFILLGEGWGGQGRV